MQTSVKSPAAIFNMPQRLLVPLFQRAYVWNEINQWEPLWQDIRRIADRYLDSNTIVVNPHFLGAVVIQTVQSPVGELPESIIIDGQQRLTTLQILLDAIQLVASVQGETRVAEMLRDLTHNKEYYCRTHEDQFKVWPTNHDRPAFNEVMSAAHPFVHDELRHRHSRMVKAHAYFTEMVSEFVQGQGAAEVSKRISALEKTARELLQIVVIQLDADENAQEIFETLNARGSLLTAADLIKNFVFQHLQEKGADVERLYSEHWRELEDGFWEREVQSGAVKIQLSSLFLYHWLNSRTEDEFSIREIFTRFKRYAVHNDQVTMEEMLSQINRASKTYRAYIEASEQRHVATTRLELFAYRMGVMEADMFRTIVLALCDAERNRHSPLTDQKFHRCIALIETWLVRRMILRLPTMGLNKAVKELSNMLNANELSRADEVIEKFITTQSAPGTYLPDDAEITSELCSTPTYKRIMRNRLRMILEAIEDGMNGFDDGAKAKGTNRIPTRELTIEHLMPQSWDRNWNPPADADIDGRRTRIHQLGNLTLLRHSLNSAISNGVWSGQHGKYAGIQKHGFLSMAMDVINDHKDNWDDDAINNRTIRMARQVLSAWPAPLGYKATVSGDKVKRDSISVADLISSGLIVPGQQIVPTQTSLTDVKATILGSGQIQVGEAVYDTPSGAGRAVRNRSTNGWGFWALDSSNGTTLSQLRQTLRRRLSPNDAEETEISRSTDGDSESQTVRMVRQQFWAGLDEYAVDHDASFRVYAGSNSSKGVRALIRSVSVVVKATQFSAMKDSTAPELRVGLELTARDDVYEYLYSQKTNIEAELGESLVWIHTEGVKRSQVYVRRQADFANESQWLDYYDWYVGQTEKMIVVMEKYLKNMP